MTKTAVYACGRSGLTFFFFTHLEDVVHVQIPRLRDDGHAPRAGGYERLQLLVLIARLELPPCAER